jgi:replication-associated recombination protein RarA
MEAILTLTLFVAALLVWKVIELNEKIENLEISTRYQLEGVAALLAELQPKQVKEIPVRLDDEIVNEMTEMTKQDMEEYQTEKAEFQKKMKVIKEKYKDDIQYEGTEYGGLDRLTREQAQEILENIKYRKANRLK